MRLLISPPRLCSAPAFAEGQLAAVAALLGKDIDDARLLKRAYAQCSSTILPSLLIRLMLARRIDTRRALIIFFADLASAHIIAYEHTRERAAECRCTRTSSKNRIVVSTTDAAVALIAHLPPPTAGTSFARGRRRALLRFAVDILPVAHAAQKQRGTRR